MRFLAFFFLTLALAAPPHPLPGLPTFAQLTLPESTDPARVALIKLAIETASTDKPNRSIYGSADPTRGGFDCSGVVFVDRNSLFQISPHPGQATWVGGG